METIYVTNKTRPLIAEAMVERGFVERGSYYHQLLIAFVENPDTVEVRIWKNVRLVFK